ncbi:sugar ABC transporter ATP-binding protein [Roseiconus nitratireducens]|uniref:Sugar ABC transporter ATP-binding protein n=1 Tax=Roseiconus nitratireducens TaxID=2605748 RepID=A0A5M6D337_9BACT|nr:sugar ABC transporter ATP-binding protein [Roseiconus nitratireducens]KAA5540702.1 sugar ABC transporter ATP-binding protein [Roseiconus nitratireducens]
MAELLRASGMTKRYGNVTVLRDVSMEVDSGEIHALLGANGAGKSTLCKIISGLTPASGGTMTLQGQDFSPSSKHEAESRGVQVIPQELNLIPTLSVAENLLLTRLPSTAGVIHHRQLHNRARVALDRFGLTEVPSDVPVGSLGVGRQQMVEIAAALDRDATLLLLDEPTAALSGSETRRLFESLDRLRNRGVGMIYISHRLEEIKQIADRVTVLRDGRYVCTSPVSALSVDAMVDLMSGAATVVDVQKNMSRTETEVDRPTTDRPKADRPKADRPERPRDDLDASADAFASQVSDGDVLTVQGIRRGMLRDISFRVRAGERFGITGLVGSGRTELLRAIFGADVADDGTVAVGQREPRRFTHPAEASAGGLAMVTEDRKQNGLLLQQSVRCNTTLGALRSRFSRWGLIRGASEVQQTEAMCAAMDTRCAGIEQSVGTLSGGNQQKVVIAKWLTSGADVFLFDEPTRGIDVSARRMIYRLIAKLASDGKGIVIVSSDLEELLENCDRIAVMAAGRMVKTFDRGAWSEDAILQASFDALDKIDGAQRETALK